MFTVALIGSDGAGKTTIGRKLEKDHPDRIKYIYMGVNLETSNLVLPTTRLLLEFRRAFGRRPDMVGPPDPTRKKRRPEGPFNRIKSGLKSSLRLVNRLGEEWLRQGVAWRYLRQGYVVLFDRHFYSDFYAHDIASVDPNRPITSRVHGYLLKNIYPKPDLTILLDAPAEVLFARKGEGTIELLERRRQEYLELGIEIEHFEVVDATQPLDKVTNDVQTLIEGFNKLGKSALLAETRKEEV